MRADIAQFGGWLEGNGFSITSGVRSQQRNAAAGGKPNSRHLDGNAIDVWHQDPRRRAWLVQWVNSKPGYYALDEGDHVHIQSTGAR